MCCSALLWFSAQAKRNANSNCNQFDLPAPSGQLQSEKVQFAAASGGYPRDCFETLLQGEAHHSMLIELEFDLLVKQPQVKTDQQRGPTLTSIDSNSARAAVTKHDQVGWTREGQIEGPLERRRELRHCLFAHSPAHLKSPQAGDLLSHEHSNAKKVSPALI